MKTISFMALILTLVLMQAGISHAKSVYCTNCSTRATQALEKALSNSQLSELKAAYDEYVQQTAQQIRMVQQNVEQYANMLQNTAQLPLDLISQVKGELSKLSKITSQLNMLRNDITGIAGVFDQLYRSQDEFKDMANLPKELLSGGSTTYQGYWDDWSERVDESTKATFQISASQLQDLENSGELESYINRLLSTPDGQQKALMAGNQLAALQIQEARQLRELMATKFQSDLSSQTKAEKEEQYSKEMARSLADFSSINTKPVDDPGY